MFDSQPRSYSPSNHLPNRLDQDLRLPFLSFQSSLDVFPRWMLLEINWWTGKLESWKADPLSLWVILLALLVSWWFGARCFGIPRVPLRIPIPFIFGDDRNPNHQSKPSWFYVSENTSPDFYHVKFGSFFSKKWWESDRKSLKGFQVFRKIRHWSL